MCRYLEQRCGGRMRAQKVHNLGGDTRAHKVHKGCWQVGGSTGTGGIF